MFDWHRRYPTQHRIADELLRLPAILGFRTRLLERDICNKFGCCASTARAAVAIARREIR